MKAVIVAAFLLVALPASSAAQGRRVTFPGQDGFALSGTLWQNDTQAPGVLLLHQCDRDRTMYSDLGAKLLGAGFRVLAFDLRGLGESTNTDHDLGPGSSPEDWDRATSKFAGDFEAAYRYLGESGTGSVVGALGASCSGEPLVALALNHPELEKVAFLSCRLSAEAERDAMQLGSRSTLFITGADDRGAAQPAGTLAYRLRSASELLLFDGDTHGAALFDQEPSLEDSIVSWFSRTER